MDWGNTSDDEGGCDGCTVVLLHCCTVVLLYCKICFVSVELYLLYLFALYYKIYINNIISCTTLYCTAHTAPHYAAVLYYFRTTVLTNNIDIQSLYC